MKKTSTVFVASLVLASCASLAPPYEQPSAPVPPAWPEGAAYAPESPPAAALPAAR
jgi:hypothetical protein